MQFLTTIIFFTTLGLGIAAPIADAPTSIECVATYETCLTAAGDVSADITTW